MYKKSLIVFTLIATISLFGIFVTPKTYERNYFEKIGLPRKFLYEEMIKLKGTPLEIEETSDGFFDVYYDGMIIVFTGGKTPTFVRAEIISNTYSFGKKKTRVGDSREKIERVCRGTAKIKGTSNNEIGIIEKNEGKDIWVYYDFDENNIVVKVVLTNGI